MNMMNRGFIMGFVGTLFLAAVLVCVALAFAEKTTKRAEAAEVGSVESSAFTLKKRYDKQTGVICYKSLSDDLSCLKIQSPGTELIQ